MAENRISYCRNCAGNCGVILNVENNRIASIRSDRENLISEGYVCIKGTLSADLHNGAEDRLVHCMKRNENGEFVRIDRLQAVEEIAAKLQDIFGEYGPRSFATFYGTTSYFDCVGKPLSKSFMHEIGATTVFSTMTVDQSSKWVTAGRMGYWASGKPVSTDADVLLIAGSNTPVSHQGYPMTPFPTTNVNSYLKRMRDEGKKLIVIDPRRCELTRYADLFLQPYPGYDVEIFGAIIRTVLKRDLHDKAFCQRWVKNLDALRDAVEPLTPDFVARRAGVSADQIEQAAEMLGRAKKAAIGTGTGHNMAAFSNAAEHFAEALTAILGAYVRAGDRIPNPGIFIRRPEVEMIVPPNRTWEKEPKCHSADFGKIMGEFPATIFPDEVLTEGKNKLRAMFVIGANPAMALSEPEKTRKALSSLDLLVTFDPRLRSGTAQHAHYVIAPTLQFERDEVTSFTDMAFHTPFAQYSPAALVPPPETMSEYEFMWRLAKRMGVQLTLKNLPFGVDFDEVPGGLQIDMQNMPEREELIRWLADQSEVPFSVLKAHPHGYKPDIVKVLRPAETDEGARLDLCPADVADEVSDAVSRPEHDGADYMLIVRRLVETYNSSFQGNKITLRRHGTNRLYVNPEDLQNLRANTGDAIEISSAEGEIIGYVSSDDTLKRGVVAMSHCWGAGKQKDPLFLKGAHTGELISMREKDTQSVNRMPVQSGVKVKLKRLGFNLDDAKSGNVAADAFAAAN